MSRPDYHDRIVPDLSALPMDYNIGDEDFLYDDGTIAAQVGVTVGDDRELHATLHDVYTKDEALAGARSGAGRRTLNRMRHHFERIIAGGVGDPYMEEDDLRVPIAQQPAFLFWRAMLREGLIDEIDIMFSGHRLTRETMHLPFDTGLDEIIQPEPGASPETAALDYHARTEFTCGACCDLAIALHERTGWPIHAEHDDHGEIRHAWVIDPAGRAVDINGVHEGDVALTKYSDPAAVGAVRPISLEDARTVHHHHYRPWADDLISAHPHHFGLEKRPTALLDRLPRLGPA